MKFRTYGEPSLRTACASAAEVAGRYARWVSLVTGRALISAVTALVYVMRVRFVRVFNSDARPITRIGHVAIESEVYVKERLLGRRPSCVGILLVPGGACGNRYLMGLWRQHLLVITSPRICRLLRPLADQEVLQDEASPGQQGDSELYQFSVIRDYQMAGGGPILSLPRSDQQRGWQMLGALGMPKGAWFVTFHGREPGFLPYLAHHSFRDFDVLDFLPAMEYVVAQGGCVVRLGDPSMRRLPALPGVIDYPFSAAKSEFMDVFLCSQCRFFVGNTSGLCLVPGLFDLPVALVNWIPGTYQVPSTNALWMPKLLYSVEERRHLTFREMAQSKVNRFLATQQYKQARLEIHDNSPEDIRDLVAEMHERRNGRCVYTPRDEELQSRYQELFPDAALRFNPGPRLGRAFLRKHAHLL